jgi:hypothetical protein
MFEVAKKMKMSRKSRNIEDGVISVKESGTSRDCSVIDIHTIIRAVHLIPKFGKGPTATSRTMQQVLQETSNYYMNNYIDHHMYNTMYDPKASIPHSIRKEQIPQI